MGKYSINDIKNGMEYIKNSIEDRQRAKGEQFANDLMESTSNGRGLWVIFLWWAWLFVFGIATFISASPFTEPDWSNIYFWPFAIIGYFVAMKWYNWGFTLRHPFWSSMLACFSPVLIFGWR